MLSKAVLTAIHQQPLSKPDGLSIADVTVPWPAQVHPRAQAYFEASRARASSYGLIGTGLMDVDVRRLMSFVILDTHVYATASYERLLVAGWFNQWLFFLDDLYDERPEMGRDTQRVYELMYRQIDVLCAGAQPDPNNPLECFSSDLGYALRNITSQVRWDAFVEGVEDYLFRGSLRSMIFWRKRVVPPPDQYVEIRTQDSAVMACFNLFQVAVGIDLPDAVVRSPKVLELSRYAILHISFLNDLVSYDKEVTRSGYPFNLLHVLMVHEGIDLAEAANRVIQQLNLYITQFVRLEGELAGTIAKYPDLGRYLGVIKSWVAGNLAFSLQSERYRHPESPFVELRS
ncbi:MAG: terpene synthase family protein [Nannocystaceae bacterium]